MKTTNRLKPRASRAVKTSALNPSQPDYFAQLAEISTSTVEHCTVAEFLNRCRVRNPDDIIRFGDKARKLADSLLLAWVTTTNDSLGVLRILPVPLMKYLYAQMAGQFGWPPMVAELEDGDRVNREELRRTEGTKKHLESAAQHAPPAVAEAFATVIAWLEGETNRMRGTEPATPHLRPV